MVKLYFARQQDFFQLNVSFAVYTQVVVLDLYIGVQRKCNFSKLTSSLRGSSFFWSRPTSLSTVWQIKKPCSYYTEETCIAKIKLARVIKISKILSDAIDNSGASSEASAMMREISQFLIISYNNSYMWYKKYDNIDIHEVTKTNSY